MYSIEEIISSEYIKGLLTKEQMIEFAPKIYKNTHNFNKVSKHIGYKIISLFFDKLVNKLMSSDRILIKPNSLDNKHHEMYITDVQQSHKKFLNSHTNGKVYAAVITGFTEPISIKLSLKRKQELKTRLEDGQPFY